MRRIVGKNIAGFLKEEIKEAAGPLQVCAGRRTGSEVLDTCYESSVCRGRNRCYFTDRCKQRL